MAHKFSSLPPRLPPDELDPSDFGLYEYGDAGPSLPIVLFSAASGLGSGILGFYVSYGLLQLTIQISFGIATLCLLIGVGGVGTLLSAAVGSRSTLANLGFSCGVIVLTLLFFSICLLSGAFVSAIILILGS